MKVWVNGTFDVIHIGHIKLLEFASKYGEVRVGIDSDLRVKEFKGDERPYNTLEDRLTMMSSIKYVDSAVGFSTEEELKDEIVKWGSDIIIIGSDYKDKRVIGSELVKEVIYFEKLDGYSTTNILNNG